MCPTIIQAMSFADLIREANDACSAGPMSTLILCVSSEIDELSSPAISANKEIALKWQATTPASDMYITHGQFIDAGDISGRKYICKQLKARPDGSRACISLLGMTDIINPGTPQGLIPSFMLLQVGFDNVDQNKLLVSASFRALEVTKFLPQNLDEICDILEEVIESQPDVESFELTIFAFRAYSIPNFRCLTKPAIDTVSPVDIVTAAMEKDIKRIAEWIDSIRLTTDSIESSEGLKLLLESLVSVSSKDEWEYPKDLIVSLRSAVEAVEKMMKVRQVSAAYSRRIKRLREQLRDFLNRAVDSLSTFKEGECVQ